MKPDYFIQVNNNPNIAIYDKGSKNNRPLVFVHGNCLGAFSFEQQLNDPLLSYYRLVSFDLPGHGESAVAAHPETIYSLSGFSNSISKIVQKLDLKDAIFIGHSFGGHLLMEAFPLIKDFMTGLLIFGAPPMQYPPAFEKMFLPHEAGGLIFKEELHANEINVLAKAFLKKEASINAAIAESIKNADPLVRKFLGADIMAGKTKDEAGIVANIKKPIAVFHGTGDQLINDQFYKSLSIPTLWKDKVHQIANSGHSPQFENPTVFNHLLINFCAYVDSLA